MESFNTFLVVLLSTIVLVYSLSLNRYNQEDYGSVDRLRFTSAKVGYYNATIKGRKRIISDLKIGIYIHNHKTMLKYEINDTDNYMVKTWKMEDFYFANIKIRKNVLVNDFNRYLKLTAQHKKSNKYVDETVLVIDKKDTRTPRFSNSTLNEITIMDNIPVGTVIGDLQVVDEQEKTLFLMDPSNLSEIREFGLTLGGRIILLKSIAKNQRSYRFNVQAKYHSSDAFSTAIVTIKVVSVPQVSFRVLP